MSGPRIDARYTSYDDGGQTLFHTSCCTSFFGAAWIQADSAKEHLGNHLSTAHGIVRDPSTLHIQYAVPYKEE